MYLLIEELRSSQYAEITKAIARNEYDVIDIHISQAMALVYSKLASRYDIAAEFAKEGAARNTLILRYVISITIYFMYDTPETVPVKRKVAYDEALAHLERIASGKDVLVGLEPVTLETGGPIADVIGYGGYPKRESYW